MPDIRMALIGAGAIGRADINGTAEAPGVVISAIADLSPLAKTLADELAIAWHRGCHSLLASARPDGAVVATPDALHVPIVLDLVAARIPVLVEKPIADTVEQAQRLSDAADKAGVPLLVSHPRRHNPIIRRAHELVGNGSLGRVVAASSLAKFLKPDACFEVAWRRSPDGGRVLINLIHEIDLLLR
jgi:predicted dehydrogenase